MPTRILSLLVPIFLLCAIAAQGQFMPEQHRSEVYNYLYRMAQKGLVLFEDQIRPINRLHIESCLDTLASKAHLLSAVEKAELRFYQREYTDHKAIQQPNSGINFLQKDSFKRWRGNTSQNAYSLLRIDPLIAMSLTTGTDRNIMRTATGAKAYGYTGKWGYFVSLADVYERGKGLDTLKQNSPETGAIGRISANKNSFNYPALRAGISYTWKHGSISFLHDHLLWGYGENARVTLSDKAPAHPHIRLDFRPFSWLRIQHTHGWLNSRLLDSTRSYGTGSGIYASERQVFISKFLAQHSITFTPMRGLDVSLGESMVYSDQFNPVYLVPVIFFKAYELMSSNENINAGSNGQFFIGISSRNQLKNTHFYATWFIDEIRANTLFNRNKRRNQSALQVGLSVTDLGLPYLTLGVEYTRIYPFTYRNLIPAQNFTHAGFNLGDWIGNNAERSLIYAKYTPVPRLKCELNIQRIRKGGPGTLDQQYFGVPQPNFLFDKQFERTDFTALVRYEWINSLYLFSSATISQISPVNNPRATQSVFQTGIQFGF